MLLQNKVGSISKILYSVVFTDSATRCWLSLDLICLMSAQRSSNSENLRHRLILNREFTIFFARVGGKGLAIKKRRNFIEDLKKNSQHKCGH